MANYCCTAMFAVCNCTAAANDTSYFDDISKVAGKFAIPHPDPSKTAAYELIHTFVEAPTAGGTLYRYEAEVVNGLAVIDLPSYYKFLNKDTITKVSPVGHFGVGYAKLNSSEDQISVTANQDGKYNVLLIGTRKDERGVFHWKGAEIITSEARGNYGKEV